MRALILLLITVPALAGDYWFEGGTLHQATLLDWVAASQENRLATAADYLVATKAIDVNAEGLDVLRERAEKLTECILFAAGKLPGDMQASSMVANCLSSLGYLKLN